ncbi:MAG: hypothetical protein O3A46_00045 [Candidatus Poribacteria bacterium]|nr:hypothetical protein [Candidatus Poribacteria bacterium]
MATEPASDDFWGESVHTYTREEAIADGTLVQVGALVRPQTPERPGTSVTICFTAALFADFQDETERDALIREGVHALAQPDPEDTDAMKLRVLREQYWVILDGDGLTFLYPSDY